MKKPILLRALFGIAVIIIFFWSMFPLTQRDMLSVFEKLASNKDKKFEELISLTRKKIEEKKIFAQVALDEAATELNVDLTKYIPVKGAVVNKDVISFVREKASGSIRLGLDLSGGAEFMLLLKPQKHDESEEGLKIAKRVEENFEHYRDVAIEILRERLESQRIYETEISPIGDKYISLKVPTVSREEKHKLLNLIKMSASLQFRLVHKDNDSLVEQYLANPEKFKAPNGYELMSTVDQAQGKKPVKKFYIVKKRAEMSGKGIVDAGPRVDQYGQRYIFLSFNAEGAKNFAKVTSENVGRLLAIVLDGKLYSAPQIKQPILGGEAQITGNFSREEAQNISNALISGSLPVDLEVAGVFDTDPTLGLESVKTGSIACSLALIVVMLFMLFYYRMAGLIANIAMIVNIILILGFLSSFGATLTLPGIAGIILTIGMSVDANVLIYERIKEELRKNKTLQNAIENAFSRVFLTIIDSNLTTLFVALILLGLGSGAVKGFGITLSIGIISSIFTSLFLSHLLFDIATGYLGIKKLKMLEIFPDTNFDFLKYKKLTALISVIFVIISIATFIVKGKESLGIDFRGGVQITASYAERIPEVQIVKKLNESGFEGARVTYKTNIFDKDSKQIEILLPIEKDDSTSNVKDKIYEILNKAFPNLKITGGDEIAIGGLIGFEFTKAALKALIVSIIGMVIYISFRFEFSYGIAAIIALLHDIIISAGLYVALTYFGNIGGELSLTVIAALMTILGYSINDTIVIFDRIREDIELTKNKTYDQIINLSVNQNLSRTFLTSFTTLLSVLFLYLIPDGSVKAFATVMVIGIFFGTYSSVCIASSLVSLWHKPLKGEK
ncbi:MAG TPA: protein translocase subunit SecD [Victivallales bacterium]|nr:protein translocase subunit SecD [Victivallales bacterium]HRU00707.1 protein translocase subunit SecD [Victivallales bacterium]